MACGASCTPTKSERAADATSGADHPERGWLPMSETPERERSLVELRARIRHEIPLLLFDYWNRARGNRRMPARADVDPLSIPRPALANTMLIDVLWGVAEAELDPRLRYRLIGTGVVDTREGLIPLDPTGWYLDQIPYRQGDLASRLYRKVAREATPDYHTGVYAPDHPRLAGTYHRLAMPLSNDANQTDMLLACFCRGAAKS
jgi:hypothetical protein